MPPPFIQATADELAKSKAAEVLDIVFEHPFLVQDLPRWQAERRLFDVPLDQVFLFFWAKRQEFRAVVAYRVRRWGDRNLTQRFNAACAGPAWMFVSNFYLACDDIGPGLYVEHGFSTVVFAKKIGQHFRVNQNVTVGTGKRGKPTIGDFVSVYTHAVVIGGVTIGDHVRIGAGAVVIEDIPAHATVVPARSRIILRQPES